MFKFGEEVKSWPYFFGVLIQIMSRNSNTLKLFVQKGAYITLIESTVAN